MTGFLGAVALGAFNDNAFKTFAALLAISRFPDKAGGLVAVAGALFIAPFLLFSTYAGWAADRYSKRTLTIILKGVEVLLMIAAIPVLLSGSLYGLFALVFLMGAHSAFFGPVKLSILPELVDEKGLSSANGRLQMMTFGGIILGTAAGGAMAVEFAQAPHLAAVLLFAAAVAGYCSSLLMPETPAQESPAPFEPNFLSEAWRSVRELQALPDVFLATVGASYFWFAGAIFQMNLLPLGAGPQVRLALGIGVGSLLAGFLSRKRVEIGLVPLGALGLVGASAALTFRMGDLLYLLLGMSAGLFVVPLQALIQQRTPAASRGRVVAAGNILSFVAILLASGWLWAFSGVFKLHMSQVFLAVSLMTAAVAAYIVRMLPDFLIRLCLYPLANVMYRVRTVDEHLVPKEGAALLVANHVSFVDAFLIAMATPRMVRFMMFRTYYDLPVVGWLFKAMGCIPVSDRDGPKAIIESFRAARAELQKGQVVCIFAEGEISRHGQMLRFKKGFERIVEGLDVPVVPVHLDQVWGSLFSFSEGKVLFKKPRSIPYPVTVSYGAPLPATVDAFRLRQAILELAAGAFQHRLAGVPALGQSFAKEAFRHPFRMAVADSLGMQASYGSLWLKGKLAGGWIARQCEEPHVGVLLPPSVGAAIANVGLSMMGKVPINLNYTASQEIVEACRAKADIKHVVTTRKFVEKLGWTVPGAIYIEDVRPRWTDLFRSGTADLATIMFTSGSTGIPKGVMLTHANVLSNLLAVAQVYQLSADDRLMGILPMFHSFGFTATLWLPLLAGMGAVYHYSPLDSKIIGDLVKKHRCTFLMGTPTFLQNFTRRVDAESFASLRCVVVGAEKLREEAAKAFEEKFGLRPLEGYGCTELSPVAAVNIPDISWPGVKQKGGKAGTVGHPLPGVFMKIVDPNTGSDLPMDTPGLLLVKGPNVMKGYLGGDGKGALRDGYYVTGDIASIDADGFVTITDRLSRFSKIGGEMVPHIRVEEKLHEAAGLTEQTFVVTSVPDEKRGERLVVLHKEFAGVKELKLDLPKLWVPDRFYQVQEFPLLGTGKLDLQRLKALAKELDGTH